ncbi:fibronectin type III domain containing 7 [Cricetulus griseus]
MTPKATQRNPAPRPKKKALRRQRQKQVFLLLAAPVLEVGSPSPDSIFVRWDAVYMAIGFSVSVMRANGLGRIWKENTTNTSLTFSSLEAGTLYTIKAYAWNANGIPGDDSTCNLRTTPCSPEIKNISKDAFSTINVHWQSANEGATYTVTAQGKKGLFQCSSTGETCMIGGLPCGSVFSVTAVAETQVGKSLPSYSVPLETVPCCPAGLTVAQVTQSIINVSWTIGTVAQTYVTVLESHIGLSKCHTHQNHCLLGCIACGINYTVALKAISPTGLTADCAYQSYSSSACCPLGVKLYRLGPNGIRIHWQASRGSANYSTDLYGSKGIFTCVPRAGLSFCDVTDIPCGDVYTVMVSPVAETGLKLTFCPKKIYSGKSSSDPYFKTDL